MADSCCMRPPRTRATTLCTHPRCKTRQLLSLQNAIIGIDLADRKQAAVITNHDSRVPARRRLTARAWELGELPDWAGRGGGFRVGDDGARADGRWRSARLPTVLSGLWLCGYMSGLMRGLPRSGWCPAGDDGHQFEDTVAEDRAPVGFGWALVYQAE